MRRERKRAPLVSQRHWLALAATCVLFALVGLLVDLNPQVDENFFFSSHDPQFQQDAKIDRIFPSGSQLIISVAAPDISSDHYLDRLARFKKQIQSIRTVTSAQSLTDGPKNFDEAEKSPFWKRLLIADNGRSSNVVVFASNRESERLASRVEAIARRFEARDFRIHIAGAPYVAMMIRRNLQHDFHIFSLTSVLLFGVAMLALFRSWKLVLGMLATCASAVLATLLVQAVFRQRIGILTANLGTIVFVVTLSHLVYMTFNWQTLAARGQEPAQAWRMTLPASFWSMICASLGFGSLLFVPARPLRELGVGGVTGTILALVCAYLMYPAFLEWTTPKPKQIAAKESASGFWERRFFWIAAATVLASVALSFGLTRLNTDPSLLDYFKKGQEPRTGLESVDRNGGVNPLTMVIEASGGGRLDQKEEYEKMWSLEDAPEDHKGVGTVLSLPVLMAEGRRHPFAFLFSWNHLLNIMNEPKHARVASTFVTKDHRFAAFYLRMEEKEGASRASK